MPERAAPPELSEASRRLEKTFDPASFEQRWYRLWEAEGRFQPAGPASSPRFVMVIPPPNVTGRLHIGHALGRTLEDVIARWKRMQGYRVLWVPGTDHAGIATQMVIERQLASEGPDAQGSRTGGLRRARLGLEAGSQGHDPDADEAPRLLARLDTRALHARPGPLARRAAGVRPALEGGPDLPRPVRRQLVSALRDCRVGPRGRAPRGERQALQDPLRRARRPLGRGRGHDAAGDDAGRHGPRHPPGRSAHGGASGPEGDPAARRAGDPDHRGPDPRGSRVRHRCREGHARARRQRLCDGGAPQAFRRSSSSVPTRR